MLQKVNISNNSGLTEYEIFKNFIYLLYRYGEKLIAPNNNNDDNSGKNDRIQNSHILKAFER